MGHLQSATFTLAYRHMTERAKSTGDETEPDGMNVTCIDQAEEAALVLMMLSPPDSGFHQAWETIVASYIIHDK
jgi:hypothetical protein